MIQPKQKRNRGSREMDDEGIESENRGNLEDDVDALPIIQILDPDRNELFFSPPSK